MVANQRVRLVASLLATGALILVHRYRVRLQTARQVRMEELVGERTKELDQLTRELELSQEAFGQDNDCLISWICRVCNSKPLRPYACRDTSLFQA